MTYQAVRGRHRPLMVLTGASVVLALVTAVGILVDPRVVTGAPTWLKPFKFAVSFALYGFTLAWLLALLPRRSRLAEWAGTTVVGVAVVELAIIVGQAGRGRASHFNVATPFEAALWGVMGTSIMVLFVAHVVVGVAVLRQRVGDRAATSAIRLGLGISLLGLLAAVPMTVPGIAGTTGAHSVGVPDGGPGMPLTGWSTVGGDLRIGHFVGLHALQALPLLAFLLSRYGRRWLDEATRARLVLVAGAAYGVLVVLLTWQALRAQPLLAPDTLTGAAVAALVVATAAGTVAAIRRGARAGRPVTQMRGAPVHAD